MGRYIFGLLLKIFGVIFILEAAINVESTETKLLIYAIAVICILIGDVLENQPTEI